MNFSHMSRRTQRLECSLTSNNSLSFRSKSFHLGIDRAPALRVSSDDDMYQESRSHMTSSLSTPCRYGVPSPTPTTANFPDASPSRVFQASLHGICYTLTALLLQSYFYNSTGFRCIQPLFRCDLLYGVTHFYPMLSLLHSTA